MTVRESTTPAAEDSDVSPFHSGEAAVQVRTGVRKRMEQIGRRAIRDFMPEQHRELFRKLPMLIVGSLDSLGRPWASALVARPGFISAPDERTLRVSGRPAPGDPLRANLVPGAPLGLLGIEFATRRRNRANGTIVAASEGGFELRVQQSFGNCPQYIHARTPSYVAASGGEGGGADRAAAFTPHGGAASGAVGPDESKREGPLLSGGAEALIARSDTFFIATAAAGATGGDARHGSDVSHRGGNAGFVRVERERDASALYWPDFRGNFMFNTLGNLAVNPRAGLLFMDFESGAALLLSGVAEIIWDGPLVRTLVGAERAVRFEPSVGVWVSAAPGLRWSAPIAPPQLAMPGAVAFDGR